MVDIIDASHEEDLSRIWAIGRIRRDGVVESSKQDISVEHFVRVILNGETVMLITCTPQNIIELVVGRLFTEGFIDGVDDIKMLSVCSLSEVVNVTLFDSEIRIKPRSAEEIMSCCTDTRNVVDLGNKRPLELVSPAKVGACDLFSMADIFFADTPLHRSTNGVHSCYLFKKDVLLYCCEDLGRHNAFDKAIGSALMDGVDVGNLAAYSSGRIPVDMVTKAIRSRIPILVTKAVPTERAILIARRYGLTLIGRANPQSFCIFSGHLSDKAN